MSSRRSGRREVRKQRQAELRAQYAENSKARAQEAKKRQERERLRAEALRRREQEAQWRKNREAYQVQERARVLARQRYEQLLHERAILAERRDAFELDLTVEEYRELQAARAHLLWLLKERGRRMYQKLGPTVVVISGTPLHHFLAMVGAISPFCRHPHYDSYWED